MNDRIGHWIRRYPIASFISVAIVIMFALIFPVVYLIPQKTMFGQVLGFLLARVGVYSPVLAAMFVSRITDPRRQPVPWYRSLAVFLPAWVVSVIIQVATLKLTVPPSASLFALTLISLPVALLPA
jgi:hypothetical protein